MALVGKRVPDAPTEHGHIWGCDNRNPGDYGKIVAEEPFGTFWMVMDPVGNCYCLAPNVGQSNHTVQEHEDGTITVTPSIVAPKGCHPYHGHLTHGIWS